MDALLIERKPIAEGTTEITLDMRGEPFTFRAGQYISLTLGSLIHADPKGNSREFSICSAPHEAHLRIAFRNSDSGFKRTLADLALGSTVSVEGPFGLFTIPRKSAGPFVFIAGGIGVTPFMSMIADMAHKNVALDTLLIYANQSADRVAYRKELVSIEKQHAPFTYKEHIGMLTPELVRKHVPHMDECTFYVAGPPKMVFDMQKTLRDAGVDEDAILAEEFVGYE